VSWDGWSGPAYHGDCLVVDWHERTPTLEQSRALVLARSRHILEDAVALLVHEDCVLVLDDVERQLDCGEPDPVRDVDDVPVDGHIREVRQESDSQQLLTDRQRDLLEASVEAGYFDTPRDCSLTDLADRMEITKSPCSSTLHRVEVAVIKQYVHRENTGNPLEA
jgi:hypothetical protein